MAKKITIDIEVNGKMQKATVSAKKLRSALDGVDKAQEKVGKSARTTDRNIKGVAQTSSNATKNFSKMAQGIGGFVVPAYASLAANVFAVTAAFNAFRSAAQLEQLESSLIRVGAVAGQNLLAVAESLREITNSAIATDEALRATAQGAAQGFSTSQLQDLTVIAKGASIALGRELPDALDRLIRGTAKLEPEILDELGIIVRLDQASEDYAASLNKTANSLTQFEKQQAFANAVTEQGLKKFGDIAKIAKANPYDQLAATFMDLKKDVFDGLNAVLTPFIKLLSESPTALAGAVSLLAATIVGQLTPALSEISAQSAASFAVLKREADDAAKKVQTKYGKALKSLKDSDISPKGFKEVLPAIKAGTASTKDFEKAQRSLNASEVKRLSNINKLKDAGKGLRGAQKAAHELLMQEKLEELAVIQAQEAALIRLKNIQATPGGKTATKDARRKAQNASARSKQAGIEADAFAGLGAVGILGGFGVAADAFKDMSKAANEAGDGLEKFKGKGRAVATTVKLLTSNLLRMIPYLGLIFIGAEALSGVLEKVFPSFFKGQSEFEKATEKTIEELQSITDAALEVKLAAMSADSAFEAAFINFKGTTGLINQAASGFGNLARRVNEIQATKIKNLTQNLKDAKQEAKEGPGFFNTFFGIGDGQRELREAVRTAQTELEKAYTEPAKIGTQAVKDVANQAKLQLKGAGIKETSASMKELDSIIADIGKKIRGGTFTDAEIKEFEGRITKTTDEALRFQASIEALPNSFAEVDKAMGGLARKAQTIYTPLITSLKAASNETANLFSKTGLDTAAEQGLFLGEAVRRDAGPLADALLPKETFKILSESIKNGVAVEEINKSVKAIVEGNLAEYLKTFEDADKVALEMKATLDTQKEALKPITALAKNSVAFTELENKMRKDIVSTEIAAIQKQKTSLELNKDKEGVEERIKELIARENVLKEEAINLEDISVQKAEAQFAMKKQQLDIQNRLTSEIQKQQQLELQMQEQQMSAELRAERERYGSNAAFEFLDRGQFELQQKINLEEKKLEQLKSDNQIEIDKQKKEMIKAEYSLLRAQLKTQAATSKIKAKELLADDDPTNDILAQDILNEADKLTAVIPTLNKAEETAIANVGLETQAKIAGVQAVIDELKASKRDLSDINVLSEGITDTFANGMADAFIAIAEGTKSAKAAFADMARSILSYIIEMTVKMLIFRAISGMPLPGGSAVPATVPAATPVAPSKPQMRYGGVMEKSYATGGIARGPDAGYMATLHGTEAVVPLPNGREIPVQLTGAGQQNNVTVNVAVDNQGNAQTNVQNQEGQAKQLGVAISAAVQQELAKQKRAGGMLSPYGVS